MEIILEKIIEIAEKIWLRLDILLGLDDISTLGSLEALSSNPPLLGLAIIVVSLILYSIYKIKSAHTKKEDRLDALLQELDEAEDSDETFISESLFPSTNLKASDSDNRNNIDDFQELDSSIDIYGDEFESASTKEEATFSEEIDQGLQKEMNENINWDSSVKEWDELYENISEGPQEKDEVSGDSLGKKESVDIELDILDKKPQEIADDEFNWDSTIEEWDKLYENISEGPQEIDEIPDESLGKKELEETTGFLETVDESLEEIEESFEKVTPHELEEVDEFLEAVSELEKENTKTVSEEEQLEHVDEFLEAVSKLEKENTKTVSEEEQLEQVDEFLEAVSKLEKETTETLSGEKQAEEAETPLVNPERIELSLEEIEAIPSGIESNLETDTTNIKSTKSKSTTTATASPLLNSILDSSVSAKTDALVSRLKTFQAELETRFNSMEITPEKTTTGLELRSSQKKQLNYKPAKVNYKSKQKSRSNKEYLAQLESFIFMAKQKNKDS